MPNQIDVNALTGLKDYNVVSLTACVSLTLSVQGARGQGSKSYKVLIALLLTQFLCLHVFDLQIFCWNFGSALAKRMVMVPESTRLHLVMTVWQFAYAGNHIILRAALNMGVSKLVFPLYRNIIALFALAPFAYFLEK